jgi:hypothetical protein
MTGQTGPVVLHGLSFEIKSGQRVGIGKPLKHSALRNILNYSKLGEREAARY